MVDRLRRSIQASTGADLDPAVYDFHVNGGGQRTALGKLIADVAAEHIPPTAKSGKPQTFLDIAAGTGIISHALAERGYAVTAVDASTEYLGHLRENYPNIRTKRVDMNREMPTIRSSAYAGATIVWANRFLKDTGTFTKEVHRLLRPGGVFLWPNFGRSENGVWKLRNGEQQPTSVQELSEDLAVVGFTEIGVVNVSLLDAAKRGVELFGRPKIIVAKKSMGPSRVR